MERDRNSWKSGIDAHVVVVVTVSLVVIVAVSDVVGVVIDVFVILEVIAVIILVMIHVLVVEFGLQSLLQHRLGFVQLDRVAFRLLWQRRKEMFQLVYLETWPRRARFPAALPENRCSSWERGQQMALKATDERKHGNIATAPVPFPFPAEVQPGNMASCHHLRNRWR